MTTDGTDNADNAESTGSRRHAGNGRHADDERHAGDGRHTTATTRTTVRTTRTTRTTRTVRFVAVPLLVVPAVVTGCRLAGTDAVTPVPQLLSLLPWLTLPAVAALVLLLAARRRVLAVCAAAVLALTGWSARPYGPDATPAHGPVTARLRVLASNVEFGNGTTALLDAVRRERPDLVFVSECDPGCVRTLATVLPHRAQVAAGGPAGSVILAARPLTAAPALPGALGMPGATVRLGSTDVRLQLAHPLPPLPGLVGSWKRELERLRAFAAAHRGRPVLLAGDFNATQDHAAFRAVLDAGALHDAARLGGSPRTGSWPQNGPLPPYAQIDHVLVSEEFAVRDARFLSLPRTDHRALLVDLDLHALP